MSKIDEEPDTSFRKLSTSGTAENKEDSTLYEESVVPGGSGKQEDVRYEGPEAVLDAGFETRVEGLQYGMKYSKSQMDSRLSYKGKSFEEGIEEFPLQMVAEKVSFPDFSIFPFFFSSEM